MKTLKEFIYPQVKQYWRKELPQIPIGNITNLRFFLDQQNIQTIHTLDCISNLKPIQKDFDSAKIDDRITSGRNDEALCGPYIVSQDNEIIDGHHRWYACLQMYPHADVIVYRILLPLDGCIKKCHEYLLTIK